MRHPDVMRVLGGPSVLWDSIPTIPSPEVVCSFRKKTQHMVSCLPFIHTLLPPFIHSIEGAVKHVKVYSLWINPKCDVDIICLFFTLLAFGVLDCNFCYRITGFVSWLIWWVLNEQGISLRNPIYGESVIPPPLHPSV